MDTLEITAASRPIMKRMDGLAEVIESGLRELVTVTIRGEEERDGFFAMKRELESHFENTSPPELFINPATKKTSLAYTDKVMTELMESDQNFIAKRSAVKLLENKLLDIQKTLEINKTLLSIEKAKLAFYTAVLGASDGRTT